MSKDLKKLITSARPNPMPKPHPVAPPDPNPQDPSPKQVTEAPAFTGRTAALWFDDEDRAIMRELTVMAVQQGIRPSDSLIVRALMRVTPRDERLFDMMRELAEHDGRKLRHQKAYGKTGQ